MTDIVVDEMNRVSANQVVSDFEQTISDEIFAWSMLQDKVFKDSKDLINSFWKEKLN